ncbi:MAG: hypothetical protein IJV89_07835 [Lentisphaeria bacterium]|nr:hypothetical protein [Lentisphaeria bacterium]
MCNADTAGRGGKRAAPKWSAGGQSPLEPPEGWQSTWRNADTVSNAAWEYWEY